MSKIQKIDRINAIIAFVMSLAVIALLMFYCDLLISFDRLKHCADNLSQIVHGRYIDGVVLCDGIDDTKMIERHMKDKKPFLIYGSCNIPAIVHPAEDKFKFNSNFLRDEPPGEPE